MYKYQINFIVLLLVQEVFLQDCQNTINIHGSRFIESHFNIVGLFPFQEDIQFKIWYNLMFNIAFTYTIKKKKYLFNNPNTIDYIIYDTCGAYGYDTITKSLMNLFLERNHFLYYSSETCYCTSYTLDKTIIGFVGASYSSNSRYMSKLMSPYMVPMVSYASTSVELSNTKDYPLFLRTIIPDGYQADIIADLLVHYGWTYVSLISTDESYGREGRSVLLKEFRLRKICVAMDMFLNIYDSENENRKIVEQLKKDTLAKVVIVWGISGQVTEFLRLASLENLYNRTWIFSEAISLNPWYLSFDQNVLKHVIFIATYSGKNEEFLRYFWGLTVNDSYSNPWLKTFFDAQNLSKSAKLTTTLFDFKDYFDDSYLGHVINAVSALLHAFKNYIRDNMQCEDAGNCTTQPIINHTIFLEKYLKTVKFNGVDNITIQFDGNGDVTSGIYHIYSIVRNEEGNKFESIGTWSLETKDVKMISQDKLINGETIVSKCSDICMPGHRPIIHLDNPCCWKCISCPEGSYKSKKGQQKCVKCNNFAISNPNKTRCILLKNTFPGFSSSMAIIIYLMSSTGIVLCSFTIFSFYRYRNTAVVSSSNIKLSSIQLAAHFFLYILILVHLFEDTHIMCTLESLCSSILFVIIISVTTVKSTVLVRIINSRYQVSTNHIEKTVFGGIFIVALLVIINILINVVLHEFKPITITSNINKDIFTVTEECDMRLSYAVKGK